jgi:hypothetical protein
MNEKAWSARIPSLLCQPRVLVPLLVLLTAALVVGVVLTSGAPPPPSAPAGVASYPAPGAAARPPAPAPGDPAGPPPRVELRPSAAQPGYVWLITTVDPQMYTGAGTSLALDAQDRPHIAYQYALAYDLRYASFDGARWVTKTVDTFGITGVLPSLALDDQDRPRIAYRISGSYMDLLYAWTGPDIASGPWVTTTVDTPGDCGIDPSLVLDGAGYPRISYNCNSCLMYAHDDGSGWQIETVTCGEGWYGWNSSLELDSQGYPHISYLAGWPISDLMYAWHDGAQWQHETIDSQGSVGLYTSLALDRQDHPHISYYDDSAYALKYAWHDGTTWHLEVVDSGHVGQEGIGKYTSLVLDAADHPHISYFDDAHNELRYAHFDGTRWLVETVDAGYAGFNTSLALDAQGRPHISYRGNRYYLRYARLIELPYAVFLPRVER